MKNPSKKTFFWLFITLTLTFSMTSFSVNGESVESHHLRRMKNLTQELQLSGKQLLQVDAIFKEQDLKIQSIYEQTRNKMRKILSSKQMTKMEEMHDRHHGKWKRTHQNAQQ